MAQRFSANGFNFHIYHATFYERLTLKNHTNLGGWVSYSTAPEPETYALFLTGLLGIMWMMRRRRMDGRSCIVVNRMS
jgi:hypothetical protein